MVAAAHRGTLLTAIMLPTVVQPYGTAHCMA